MRSTPKLEGTDEASGGSTGEPGITQLVVRVVGKFEEGTVGDEAGLVATGDGDQELGGGEKVGRDQFADGNGFGHEGAPACG